MSAGRERMVAAAFAQFASRGFETTTVDDIAEQAGVSRRTFFRHFATKEDVVFPDHDAIRAAVAADMERRRDEPPLAAVCAAIRLVLDDYIEDREVSLARFALTRQVTALRDREVASVHRYQRMFARYLHDRTPDTDPLEIELMAATVVAAHNSVLREWLVSGGRHDPRPRLTTALRTVQRLFAAGVDPTTQDSAVVAFRIGTPIAEIVDAINTLPDAAPRRAGRRSRRRPQR